MLSIEAPPPPSGEDGGDRHGGSRDRSGGGGGGNNERKKSSPLADYWNDHMIVASVDARDAPDRELDRRFLCVRLRTDEEMIDDGEPVPPEAEGWVPALKLPPANYFMLEPTHDARPEHRDVWYITGPAGVGKSVEAHKIAARYAAIWPRRRILLVTNKEGDSTIKVGPKSKLGIRKLKLEALVDPGFGELKPGTKPGQLNNALVIFDDIEGMKPHHDAAVRQLQSEIGNKGRQFNISMIVVSHLAVNYGQTRAILREAHWYVVFPGAGGDRPMRYLLQNYGGLPKGATETVLRSRSRWAAVHTARPPLVITEHAAWIQPPEDPPGARSGAGGGGGGGGGGRR